MNLEKRLGGYNSADDADKIEFIHPLETVEFGRRVNFKPTAVPSDQGELLLEFLRRHLLSTGLQY